MRAIDLVAFDLDGTLVDSVPDLNHCLASALAALGRPPPSAAETRTWIGGGIELLLQRALEHRGPFTDSDYASALARFHDCYRDNLFTESRTYAGVAETLEILERSGLTLCCVTNKRHSYATRLLELAGLARHFAFVHGGDSFAEKKPHPRPLIEAALRAGSKPVRCALVGDSPQDCRAAAAAGFRFVWAAYGYCDSLEGIAAPTDYLRIGAFAELVAALGPAC